MDPLPEETFARRIRELRGHQGISQTALAGRLERRGLRLDGTAITRMERGTRAIRVNEAVAIAAAFGTTLDHMLTGPLPPEEELRKIREEQEPLQRQAAEVNSRVRYLEERAVTLEWQLEQQRATEEASEHGQHQ